jgi:hypothetical protein
MGEYRIPYEGVLIRKKDKLRGDRGVIDRAEAKALAICRALMKQGHRGIVYREVVTAETPHRQGYISVTW